MKRAVLKVLETLDGSFSALGRAVWDETVATCRARSYQACSFSALGRAVWDETPDAEIPQFLLQAFQCSRSSRMG